MTSSLKRASRTLVLAGMALIVGCNDDPGTLRRGSLPTATPDVNIAGTSADVPTAATMRSPSFSLSPAQTASLAVAATAVVRVYQDEQPWFGANRAHTTLLSLGKVLNSDYFIHPLAALSAPIPAGTLVVIITSNSNGGAAQAVAETAPAAQANLAAFVSDGGTLIVDMGDNLVGGGFTAPGAVGTPTNIFPNPCDDATLTATAATDQIVLGPDGVAGGGDDLTDTNIDTQGPCYVAHGNLDEGIVLPAGARRIMTAAFPSGIRTIMADYTVGSGCVILDTNTKEFMGQQPPGSGPGIVMRNLFSAALRGVGCVLPITIDVKPGSDVNPINQRAQGRLPVAVLTSHTFDATTVNPATVTVGDEAGTDTRVATRNNGTLFASLEDVDGDGDVDLVLHFEVRALVGNGDLTPTSTKLVLRGATTSGTPVRGEDVVRVVP
jgi:hypothetical protein